MTTETYELVLTGEEPTDDGLRRTLATVWLFPLVAENYRQRRLGLLPDEWFWADQLLLELGFACLWKS